MLRLREYKKEKEIRILIMLNLNNVIQNQKNLPMNQPSTT
jgi:hypothetical protein